MELFTAIRTAKRSLPLLTEAAFRKANPVPGVIAALDIGTRYIGLSLSDPLQRIAAPHQSKKLIRANQKDLKDMFQMVLLPAQVQGMVVGYPIPLDQQEGKQCLFTLQFLRSIWRTGDAKHIKSLLLVDEAFSSEASRHLLQDFGVKEQKRRQHIDHLSATLILQDYLDRKAIK